MNTDVSKKSFRIYLKNDKMVIVTVFLGELGDFGGKIYVSRQVAK
jgi:hypothetical protein